METPINQNVDPTAGFGGTGESGRGGMTQQPQPVRQSRLGGWIAMAVLMLIVITAIRWGFPRLGDWVATFSEGTRMGLWLCAAALIHGLTSSRRK